MIGFYIQPQYIPAELHYRFESKCLSTKETSEANLVPFKREPLTIRERHTMVFLSIIGEGCGVPDIGVEPGVLISSIIILTFSGTLVASLQISCHPGSLELRNSAHCIQM